MKLCPPALIYLIFSCTQIIIDIFKEQYNTAFFKSIVAFLVTFLLNVLCEGGLSVISWFIVFIPFILMTVIVSMLLYVFGLNAATGSTYSEETNTNTPINKILVINPEESPQFSIYTIPNQKTQTQTQTQISKLYSNFFPNNSSSSAYES